MMASPPAPEGPRAAALRREEDEAARRIARAATTLIGTNPFLATLLLRLHRTPDPAAETMWTDGTTLGYAPAFVQGLAADELLGVLAHEVLHVAALHPWRRGSRDPHAWNVACDQAVNHLVVDEMGLRLPAGSIPGVPGRAAEELYVGPPPPTPGGGRGAGGDGGEASRGAPADPGGCGEVRAPRSPDGTPLGAAAREDQMREARVAVQQAMNAARRAGLLPAGLARELAEAAAPRVPWQEILARFLDERARHDYAWSRPNRRYLHAGVVLPSLARPAYGQVVLGCDASGSIGPAQLREIGGEVLGVLAAYAERGQAPELTVAWFDTAVHPQVVTDAEALRPQGGGGTSYRVVFEWLETLQEPPRAVVMVTDGHCLDWGRAPEVPVLWVLTGPNRAFRPPFGEVAWVRAGRT